MIIENNNNVYELKGALVKSTVHLFQNEFQNIFDWKTDLTISTIDLEKIDGFGVNAIAQLHHEAISKQKRLSIIGLGNQELFDHFKAGETSEIGNNISLNVTGSGFKALFKFFQNYKRKFILPRVNTIHI